MGNNRYIVGWIESVPYELRETPVKITGPRLNQYIRDYLKSHGTKKSVEAKTCKEAYELLALLNIQDCKCAFIYDKAGRELLTFKILT